MSSKDCSAKDEREDERLDQQKKVIQLAFPINEFFNADRLVYSFGMCANDTSFHSPFLPQLPLKTNLLLLFLAFSWRLLGERGQI